VGANDDRSGDVPCLPPTYSLTSAINRQDLVSRQPRWRCYGSQRRNL